MSQLELLSEFSADLALPALQRKERVLAVRSAAAKGPEPWLSSDGLHPPQEAGVGAGAISQINEG